ncbi:hypothetical protein D3C72_2539710 [compost metagenome]
MHKAFVSADPNQPPRHLGQCAGWDFNGSGVAAIYPQFVGWQPLVRQTSPAEAAKAPVAADMPSDPGKAKA